MKSALEMASAQSTLSYLSPCFEPSHPVGPDLSWMPALRLESVKAGHGMGRECVYVCELFSL